VVSKGIPNYDPLVKEIPKVIRSTKAGEGVIDRALRKTKEQT